MTIRGLSRLALVAGLLAAVPACTITWREPTIEPLDNDRVYAAGLESACAAAERVVRDFGLEVQETREQGGACLVESDFRVLPDIGDDPVDHLDEVAYVGVGGFIGGRYAVTVTARSREDNTRIKVVTRIEGYVNEEFGYQVLRSRGVIEREMFAALADHLGQPADRAD